MNTQARLQTSLGDRYRVEREIGAGGMATVYLAQDLKHARMVALKVLNADLGAVLGVERFLSEIKVTASLQHPNLLPLFDSGEADGLLFYVMPYVDGESLRAKLAREKQLSVDESLRLTIAIAGALDYAHRHGVIHRDLKPENVLLQDGQPLLADFGIALAVSNAGGSRVTQTGVSLGTPQYMSPEQATGDRVIDGRTDIYSLAAMLFEMLTGDPPYAGSSAQAVIARVLTEPPRSVRTLRASVPEHVDAAIERALAKIAADRFPTAHEFAEALQGRSTTPYATQNRASAIHAERTWRRYVPWGVAAASIAIAGIMYVSARASSASSMPMTVSTLLPPPGQEFSESESMGAFAPDGRQFAFISLGPRGETQLWIRRLDTLAARRVDATDGASAPFWSPDGRSIGFFAKGSLLVSDVAGGVTRAICPIVAAHSGTWGARGTIAVASDSGVIRADVAKGECSVAVKNEAQAYGPRHVWFLPDGKHVLYTRQWSGSYGFSIYAADILDGTTKLILSQAADPSYVAPGILLFGQNGIEGSGRLWARRFNSRTLNFDGAAAVPLTEGVRTAGGVFAYAVSDGPSLAYLPGRGDNGEIVTDRAGHVVDTLKIKGAWMHRWAKVHPWMAAYTDGPDVKLDLERHTQSVIGSVGGLSPTWSPGDSLLASGACGFEAKRCGLRVTRLADGHDSILVRMPATYTVWPSSWSNDGRYLVYTQTTSYGAEGGEVWAYDFTAHKPVRAVGIKGNALEASLSPDGRWIAYRSTETGTWEVYVRPFQRDGEPIRLSTAGGRLPQWNANSRELFYQAPDGNVMVSDVQTGGAQLIYSAPRALVMAPGWTRHTFFDIGTSYDVRPDGQRFAFRMSATGGDQTGTALVLVSGWRGLVK